MIKFAPVQSVLRILLCPVLGLFCVNWSAVDWSSLFWVFNFAPVLGCFVLLKFAPVQSIFGTNFAPVLGYFLFLWEKKGPHSPSLGLFCTKICPSPKYAPIQSIFGTKFCPSLSWLRLFFDRWKMPRSAPGHRHPPPKGSTLDYFFWQLWAFVFKMSVITFPTDWCLHWLVSWNNSEVINEKQQRYIAGLFIYWDDFSLYLLCNYVFGILRCPLTPNRFRKVRQCSISFPRSDSEFLLLLLLSGKVSTFSFLRPRKVHLLAFAR